MSAANTILFGADPTPGIVAVEAGPESVTLYRRVDGAVVSEVRPFRRWMLTAEKHPLEDAQWTKLDGDGYCWLAEFRSRAAYENARYWIRDARADHYSYPSAGRQYLARSGQTLFKDMSFDDPVRLQLDIETIGLDAGKPHNEIFLVSISDNHGYEASIDGEEGEILRRLVEILRERDPDIIEGHNIFGFDLPYLAQRAKMRNVKLALGRDGSEMTFAGRLNCAVGYFSRPYTPVHIHGRQVIDTLFAVQRYDISRAELSSHGLKAVAVALGIAEEDRELIPHNRIAAEWRKNPERVCTYSLQDVRETRSLAGLVCPAEFYLTQMIPDVYQRAATSGNGEKVNSLFVREYLRQGHAIPKPMHSKPVPGGYTELRLTGVLRPIVKCDVESLYPSLMLTRSIKPKKDILDVFLPALEELTTRRLDAKRKARETTGAEHAYWDGLQGSFKIIINSFYGYLGGSTFNFNDYDAAAEVTTSGQAIVRQIVDELERTGSRVVEVDTDGVYFRPPDGIVDEDQEIGYIDSIGETLPQGIRLAHDGRYRAMISLKMKNYVLEKYSGDVIFRGSSLRSRAEEPFLLEFLAGLTDHLLRDEQEKAVELYKATARRIETGELKTEDFARRERVTEKTFTSAGRKRLARAVREQNARGGQQPESPVLRDMSEEQRGGYPEGADTSAAVEHPEPVEGRATAERQPARIGDYVTVYQRKDGSIALAEEYDHDEDTDYLLQKLYKFAGRLREAFGDDFDQKFPDPHKTRGGQQTLELF